MLLHNAYLRLGQNFVEPRNSLRLINYVCYVHSVQPQASAVVARCSHTKHADNQRGGREVSERETSCCVYASCTHTLTALFS